MRIFCIKESLSYVIYLSSDDEITITIAYKDNKDTFTHIFYFCYCYISSDIFICLAFGCPGCLLLLDQ